MRKSTIRTIAENVLFIAVFVVLAYLFADGFAERRAIEARQRESIRVWEERN